MHAVAVGQYDCGNIKMSVNSVHDIHGGGVAGVFKYDLFTKLLAFLYSGLKITARRIVWICEILPAS